MNGAPRPERPLNAGLAGLVGALEWLSGAMLLAMMVLTFVDVVGRYVFAAPVFGGAEILSAMLAFIIFAGLGITNARDDHIVLELFDHRVRGWMGRRAYGVMIQGFSILAMVLIAAILAVAAMEAWEFDSRSYVLGLPTWLTVGAIAALAGLSVVSQVAGVVVMSRAADPTSGA